MKIALIGLGMVADTHLAAIQHSQNGLRLAGVCARDRDRVHTYADKASQLLGYDVKSYEDADAIARDPGVDFAIVATPPDARLSIAQALVAKGKPILMEKPVERTLDAARSIVALCENAAVPFGIVFQHRAREASRALKDAVSRGALGTLQTIEIRVPWWRSQSYYDEPGRGSFARDGGGVMISQAIHTLDLALWLAGPMASVQALMHTTDLHRLEAEDWAGAVFEMDSGARGVLMSTTAAFPGEAESLTLQGTKAGAHLASGELRINYLDGRTETHGASATTGGGADPMAFTHEWHQSVIEDFADSLRNHNTPLASGRSALMAHAVIDAMERSNSSGNRIQVSAT